MMQAALCARPRPLASSDVRSRPARPRARLSIQANTLWSLLPDPRWCAREPQKCKLISQVDLTGAIGKKRLCSVASHDFQSEEVIDLCILDHGGLHLVFEAEGAAAPLDSPSLLYITDVDSQCTIAVDGQELPKGQRTRVKPGAVLAIGHDAMYQVQRNVFAHA